MGMVADLFVKLGLKSDSFNKGVDDAKNKVGSFGGVVSKIGGIIAGAFAIGKIISFSQASLSEYAKQERAEKSLLTALKNRIDIQRSLIDDSNALAKTTLFADDEIIAAYSMLAAFTKNETQLKKLMPVVQDFATAMGIDLGSAAKLIGKTFGSSTNALARYGIEVTGAAGSTERLNSITGALLSRFEGQAVAAANTATGSIEQLTKSWGEFKEEFGKGIAGVLASGSGGARSIIETWTKDLNDFFFLWGDKGSSFWQKLGATADKSLWGSRGQAHIDQRRALTETIDSYSEMYEIAQGQGKALDAAKASNSKTVTTLADQVAWLKQEIKAANDELRTTPAGEEWQKQKDKVDALTESLKKLQTAKRDTALIPEMQGGRGIDFGDPPSDYFPTTLSESGKFENPLAEDFFKAENVLADMSSHFQIINDKTKEYQGELLAEWEQFNQDFASIIGNGMMNGLQILTEGLTNLASGAITSKDFGNQVLKMVGSFMVQLGTLFIVTSKAYQAFETSLTTGNFPGMLIAGVALVAAGAAVSALAAGGTKGNASTATGYSNYSASSGTASMSGAVVFEVEGTKLKGVLNNTDRAKNSYR